MNKEIYLDNAATTRVLEESAELAKKIMTEDYGNPSSVHLKGFYAEKILNESRDKISKVLSCDPKDLIFTSGATESNALAIIGGCSANVRVGKHIVVSGLEHSSVRNTMKYMESIGYDITYLPSDSNGYIRLDLLSDAIQRDTCMVSCVYVNSEVGAIQPIEEIGNMVKMANEKCLFHVDGVQAVGKLPINLKRSRIDLLSASGHKFHSPKGTGFLYKRKNVKLNSLVFGGGQEGGFRSGTENLPGIAAMANSITVVSKDLERNFERLLELKRDFCEKLLLIDDVYLNGSLEKSSPYILNVSFVGVRSEVLIHALEEKGIFVSAQSACSSHVKTKSETLSAMGIESERSDSAIRFSFNKDTDKKELEECLLALNELLPKLRKFKRM